MNSLQYTSGGIVINDHPAVTGTEVVAFDSSRKFKWAATIWTGLSGFPWAVRLEGTYEANAVVVPMEIGDFVMFGRPLAGGGLSHYLFEITGAETPIPMRDEPQQPFLREAFLARGWLEEYRKHDLELPWYMR